MDTQIYISSTYEDLRDHRKAVSNALQRAGYRVKAMETYAASNDWPADKCLADVSASDLYVGIFAYRYGYVPSTDDNPKRLSITEMELRRAIEDGKSCLCFFVDKNTPWPPLMIERGEGEIRLAALRTELTQSRLTDFFTTPDDLAMKVATAVSVWEHDRARVAAPRQPREVTHPAYLVCAAADETFASGLARLWGEMLGRDFIVNSKALFADRAEELKVIEASVRQCHSTIVILSDAALGQMCGQREVVQRALALLKARTGNLVAFCRSRASAEQAAEWGSTQTFDASAVAGDAALRDWITELDPQLAPLWPARGQGTVGLPLVVIAMTAREAAELSCPESLLPQKLGTEALSRFVALKAALGGPDGPPFRDRYGAVREMWRPFAGDGRSVSKVVSEVVEGLNRKAPPQLGGQLIKPQYYSFDALYRLDKSEEEKTQEEKEEERRNRELGEIYQEIAEIGCVVLLDELSMFHPAVDSAFRNSALFGSRQAAVVTISPFDPYGATPSRILENELRSRLSAAFDRFTHDCDPQCEIGIGSEQRLKRWLHSGLPRALEGLRRLRPDQDTVGGFMQSMGINGPSSPPALLRRGPTR